ncbi:hypothetical protein BH09PLA1_BH09PLA1_26140 [soil metagenome]
MFRQTLIVIALITLVASLALADDVPGTYVSVKGNSTFIIHLAGSDGSYRGYAKLNGQRIALCVNEDQGVLLGELQFREGRESFSASAHANGLVLHFRDGEVVLQRDSGMSTKSDGFAPPDANGNLNFPQTCLSRSPIDPGSFVPQEGRFYRYALPPGWQVHETPLIVEMISPDGITRAAAGFISGNHGSPTEVIHNMIQQLGDANVRIAGSTELGGGMIEMEWTYTREGRPMKGAIACNVVSGIGAMIAVIECPLEHYARDRRALRAVSGSVMPTSPQAGHLQPASALESDLSAERAAQDRKSDCVQPAVTYEWH